MNKERVLFIILVSLLLLSIGLAWYVSSSANNSLSI